MLKLAHITKTYPGAQKRALQGVSLDVKDGEFVCLIGPSGCGKSTVLKIIAGLERIDSGAAEIPKEVSMVFQSGALLPWLSARENVALGLRVHAPPGAKKTRAREIEKQCEIFLTMVGLADFMDNCPRELSGGQRQRVGLARALAVKPKVLLLDEPFSALDPKTTDELHKDLLKIWKDSALTVVMVSHLIEEAVSLADRVVLMQDGAIREIFPVTLPYPRRESGAVFHETVQKIRKAFFA